MTEAHQASSLFLRKAERRDVIRRAKGILMASQHVTNDQAFHLLRQASQRLNIKLSVVAEEVNLTGTVPARHHPADRVLK